MNKNYKKGFTLIELLVVASIISLLSSVVLSSINTAKQKADDSRRISDLKEIASAINMYYSDNGKYPPIGLTGTGTYTTTCDSATGPKNWDSTFEAALVPKYIKALPYDPRHSQAICSGSWNYYYGFTNPLAWNTWPGCTQGVDTLLYGLNRPGGKVFQNACIGTTGINSIKFTK